MGDAATAAAGTRTVRVRNNTMGINNSAGVPAVFRYYNGQNPPQELLIDTIAGTGTNLIRDIRRIDIALGVETEEVDPTTHLPRQMIYSTSVLVRNHVLN